MWNKILLGLFLVTYLPPACTAYGVLTHEAIIDAAWKDSIEPLLRARYPNATPEELLRAHAYVYGGAIIQDMGYYPFGSKFFSDLTHYVRSGDFVIALIEESQTLNEYAFALGALAPECRVRPLQRPTNTIPAPYVARPAGAGVLQPC
jgi:hypothetical protein